MTTAFAYPSFPGSAARRQFVIAAIGSVLFLGAVGLTFFIGLLTPLLPDARNTAAVTVLMLVAPPVLCIGTGMVTWFRRAAQRGALYRPRSWAPYVGLVLLAVLWVLSNEMMAGAIRHHH